MAARLVLHCCDYKTVVSIATSLNNSWTLDSRDELHRNGPAAGRTAPNRYFVRIATWSRQQHLFSYSIHQLTKSRDMTLDPVQGGALVE